MTTMTAVTIAKQQSVTKNAEEKRIHKLNRSDVMQSNGDTIHYKI